MNLPPGTKVYPYCGLCHGCGELIVDGNYDTFLVVYTEDAMSGRRHVTVEHRNVVFYCKPCEQRARDDIMLTVVSMDMVLT